LTPPCEWLDVWERRRDDSSISSSFSPPVNIKRDAARALIPKHGENEPALKRQRIVLDSGMTDEASMIGGVSQPSMTDVGPNCVG
jgi:hypothetical protein